jgi:hypothetical protein
VGCSVRVIQPELLFDRSARGSRLRRDNAQRLLTNPDKKGCPRR